MISRLKGGGTMVERCNAPLSVLVFLEASLHRSLSQHEKLHWRVSIVEQRFDIWDTSYRRRSIHRHYSVSRGARVCSTPISVTLAGRTRIRLSFRGKLNGYRICGIRAFRPGGCFLQQSFRMENPVQGNHKQPPFPSSSNYRKRETIARKTIKIWIELSRRVVKECD